MITRCALALAVLSAWALSRRVPTGRQREVHRGLELLLAVDLIRLLRPPAAIDHAASVAWYAVTAALVWRGVDRPTWLVSKRIDAVLAIASIALAALPTGPAPAHWLALAVQVASVVIYLSPHPTPLPGQVETVALLVAASSVADVAGPWLRGSPTVDWFLGKIPAVATWLAVAGWETRCWIRARRGRG